MAATNGLALADELLAIADSLRLSSQVSQLEDLYDRLNAFQNELILLQLESPILNSVLAKLNFAKNTIDKVISADDVDFHYQSLPVFSGEPGRPKYAIHREQLQFLLNEGFNIPTISKLVGVSKRTVWRRMSDFGLSIGGSYSVLTDAELDNIVREILDRLPNTGMKRMHGLLVSQGVRVPIFRTRESVRRIDPLGVDARRLHTIKRRSYNVPCPNALWHIDGNHKLIR